VTVSPAGRRLRALGLAALLLVVGGTYLMRPVADPDFFWHLKTGEWIWQHGRLPGADPFTFTGPQQPDASQLFILRGYPLAQLAYYGLQRGLGWAGIFALRFLIFAGFVAVLLLRFGLGRTSRRSWVLAGGLLLLFGALVLEPYPLDRPQVLSFLFFGCLLALYDLALRRTPRRPLLTVALPAFGLMALWSGCHGGYLVGMAALLLLGAAEAVLAILRRRSRPQRLALLALVGGGLAGGFASVNRPGLALLRSLAPGATHAGRLYNTELFSTVESFRRLGDSGVIAVWVLMAVVAVLVVWAWELDSLPEALLLFAVGGYAFSQVRHVPFFVVAAIPFVYLRLGRLPLPRLVPVGLAAVCAVTFGVGAADEVGNVGRLRRDGAVSTAMPRAAADFVAQAGVGARIFNPYRWGGYLIWRLGPGHQLFQDGRGLEQRVTIDWLSCQLRLAGPSGRALWEDVLDRYRVDLAILPKFSDEPPRRPHELSLPMSRSPAWRVIFHDPLAVVFQRVAPAP